MAHTQRGFTLIELMIAGAISAVVALAGFIGLTMVQRNAERQTAANEVVAAGRQAMEIIARDIRSAGHALDYLPGDALLDLNDHCLGTKAHPSAASDCPAILEPHPWRLVLARNAWVDAGGAVRSRYQASDQPPPPTRAFDEEPENVVMYRFVPEGEQRTLTDSDGQTRLAWIGRIERVVNPFGFERAGAVVPPQVSVLLDNVVLDDRMRVDPADVTKVDHRYDFSLFMYQVLTTRGEFNGELADRGTTLNQTFLTPPLRFFAASTPAAIEDDPPYMPDYAGGIVGLDTRESGKSPYEHLLAGATNGMEASVPGSDLRLILDRNRIRAVRTAFKVMGAERSDNTTGIDLDGDPSNGVAPIYQFETTTEIKTLAQFTVP